METVPSSEPTTPLPANPPPTTVLSSEPTTPPPATPPPTTVPSSEPTTPPPTTLPPGSTESTGATEDSVPFDNEVDDGGTPSSVMDNEIELMQKEVEEIEEDSVPFVGNDVEDGGTPSSVMDNEVELIQKEVEIERDIVIVSEEINKTTNAINLLQCETLIYMHTCTIDMQRRIVRVNFLNASGGL